MRRLLRQARLLTALALFFALPTFVASAAPPPGAYFNGFEDEHGRVVQLQAAHDSPRAIGIHQHRYANGVPSADGSWHARLEIDPSPDACASGGGPQPVYYGPYTNWGGYSSFFPPGGYYTRVDIYLDVAWAAANLDQRFDWSSAVNTPDGMHPPRLRLQRRDRADRVRHLG